MQKAWLLGLLFALVTIGSGCNKELKDPDKELKYTGPLIENANVLTLYSDSAQLLIRLQAPVQQEFEGGDSVFPKGLFVEFYEDGGRVTSTLRANYGKHERTKDLYVVRGKVVVENLVKQEKLETEELYWNKNKAQIYTDKFVKITTKDEVLMGHGLKAKQDFSDYEILNPTGTMQMK